MIFQSSKKQTPSTTSTSAFALRGSRAACLIAAYSQLTSQHLARVHGARLQACRLLGTERVRERLAEKLTQVPYPWQTNNLAARTHAPGSQVATCWMH